jgi:hypothetical protein
MESGTPQPLQNFALPLKLFPQTLQTISLTFPKTLFDRESENSQS